MFGSDDQNQNPDAGSSDAADPPMADAPAPGTPTTVDTSALSSASPADMPTENIGAEPDVVASAPSAPTIPDPMVTPSAQPVPGINGVPTQDVYAQPTTQIGLAKPSNPGVVSTAASTTGAALDPDLAQIKLRALQSLEPLVGQLDQAPDEKFKTVMMLIQASDNSKMLASAYEAASQITDEKTRAQALLDVVNEINYFTAQAQAKQ